MFHHDTIVALSTPPGRGAIAIVRLSGPGALTILRRLVGSDSFSPTPNLLTLKRLVDPNDGEELDEALVCFFQAPNSFTGEDVVELHCHGAPVLLRRIIDIALALDARLADPGEFSLRAVAHGRITLTKAEAIRDLIDAQTEKAVRQATRQLKGAVSNALQPAKDALVKIIVRLESSLEFVEEDLPTLERGAMASSLQSLKQDLFQLAETYRSGKLVRDGIKVALVGRPNVGKSSLFNRLLGESRAIVTHVPGTTRDTLAEWMDVEGIPVRLIDTAGIRDSTDTVESMGVERARREAADADLLIVVLDGSELPNDEDRMVLAEAHASSHVVALNKSDLPAFSAARIKPALNGNGTAVITVSAISEDGLEQLRQAIIAPFAGGNGDRNGLLVTNARHHDLLRRSVDSIEESRSLFEAEVSEEIVLVGLHNALRYLGELTGEMTPDEMLGKIFSTFCIGK